MSNTRYEGALEAYRAGRYEDAIQQFLELLHEDPLNPQLHASLGDSYRYAGQVDNANWHYQQVFKLSDDPELISYAVGAQVPSASEAREKSTKFDRSSEAKPAPKGVVEDVEHAETSDRSARTSDKTSTESDDRDEVDRNAATPNHLPSPMSSDETDREGSSKPAISSDSSTNPGYPLQPRTKPNRQKQGKSERSAQLNLKVVGLAIALAAIPVTAVGITAYYSSRESLQQGVKRSQEYKAVSLANNLHRFLLNQYENAKMLGSLFANSDTPAKPKPRQKLQLQNRLNLYKQAYKSFDGIAIFDPSGKLVVQSSGNSIPSTIEQKTLQRVIRGNTTVIAKPAAVDQTYVIDFATPISNPANQRVELVIQARMTLPHLFDALGGDETNFFVVNADGNYVLAADTNSIGKDATGNYPVLKELLAANSIDTKEASWDGEKKLLSYAPPVQLAGLPELNWRSLVSIDANKAMAPLGGLLELCLMGAALALILVGAIAYFISRLSINRIRTAKNTVEEVLADRARQQDANQDDLEALLTGVDEIANLQDLFERQKLEAQHLQHQRAQLFKALQRLAHVETADLQISEESISFLVEKIQVQLAQRDSKDIGIYLEQLIAQQNADREGRQQQSTAILNTIQEVNRSNSEAIAQAITQISRLTTATDVRSESRDLTISDRSIDAIATRLAQLNQTGIAPNTLISGQGGQEIDDLVLQLIDQQRVERDRLQQQTTEILQAIQALNRSDTDPQAPQEITISDRSINSLAEKVQAQIGQRDVSELLLQLVEQQQAQQEKLQQQSAEILSALQALNQSNTQLSDRLNNQLLEQSTAQLVLESAPPELTVSETSINSLVERVKAEVTQPEIADRLQALQQLVEQQSAERQQQQEQTTEILNAIQALSQSNARLNAELSARLNERLAEEFANQAATQPELQDLRISEASLDALANRVVTAQIAGSGSNQDVSDILMQLIEQQQVAQERSQVQSTAILSAIQQLAAETREPSESIVSDRSIDLLVSRLQAQFPLQTSSDETVMEAARSEALEIKPEDELSKAFDDVFDKLDELDELDEILQASQPKSALDLPVPVPISAGIPASSAIAPEQLKQAIAQATNYLQRIKAALGHSERATAQIAADAIRQVDEITYTIDFLHNMAASIQSVADVADRFASAAHNTSTSAITSNQVIEQSAGAIAQLRATIAATAKKVKHLGESSQHISKVSALINEVAVRTNYLAINASLEASRGGSDGRGLTNIAEEVGELATRSAAATKEIEELIENIQADSGEVINFMELGTAQVVECTQLVEAAKQNLQQIAIASQQIDQLAEPILQFTASQATSSGSITNLIQDIAQISQRTTRSSQQLSQSLQDTAESLEQLRLTVNHLELEQ